MNSDYGMIYINIEPNIPKNQIHHEKFAMSPISSA